MSVSKIRIKLGAIEIEYEGSESFLKAELPELLKAVSELYSKSSASHADSDGMPPSPVARSSGPIQLTTGSIAAKLAVKSGPELVAAAAAQLTLVQNKGTFSRQELIDEMKTASQYFKKSYVSNLSNALNTLVKDGKFNESREGHFALTAPTLAGMEARIV